jgi:hypothetical protein
MNWRRNLILGMFLTSLIEVTQQSPKAKMLGYTGAAFPFVVAGSEAMTWK